MTKKRSALITGASAGLGAEFARLFARDGYDLVLVARRRDRLEALATELRKAHGIRVEIIAADLEDPSVPQAIFDQTRATGLAINVLVNNAGFGTSGEFARLPLDRELAMVQVNVMALLALTRLFLPAMLAERDGGILNIGSTAGFQPGPGMATYYASKAMVISFSNALWFELRGSGVTVTLSNPGATRTEFGARSGADQAKLFSRGVARGDQVAREAYQAMLRGRRQVIHGILNRLVVLIGSLTPTRILLSIAAGLNRK